MTVKELIDKLAEVPSDAKVDIAWEVPSEEEYYDNPRQEEVNSVVVDRGRVVLRSL